jgi:hypothetical protein
MPLVTVPAKDPWFDTGIRVQRGETYLLNVGPGQTWTDWYITCGPEGKTTFIQALGLPWLRVRRDDDGEAAYFFTLIAAIANLNSPRVLVQTFAVGRGPRRFVSRTHGALICFANDVPGGYWNNRGSINVSVEKLEA